MSNEQIIYFQQNNINMYNVSNVKASYLSAIFLQQYKKKAISFYAQNPEVMKALVSIIYIGK